MNEVECRCKDLQYPMAFNRLYTRTARCPALTTILVTSYPVTPVKHLRMDQYNLSLNNQLNPKRSNPNLRPQPPQPPPLATHGPPDLFASMLPKHPLHPLHNPPSRGTACPSPPSLHIRVICLYSVVWCMKRFGMICGVWTYEIAPRCP